MSIENTKLGELVKQIKEKGGQQSTSTILYYLFCGDDVAEAFDGVDFIEDTDWREAGKKVDEFLDTQGYKWVDGEGGGEGQGEYCYGVIQLGESFFKAEWEYYSYNGCEFDWIERTVKEVTPKQKMIVVYE